MAEALSALAVAATDVETHTKAFLALESADGKISGEAPPLVQQLRPRACHRRATSANRGCN